MESEVGRDATIAEADIKSEFATGTDGAVHDEEERLIHSKTGSLKNERRWTAGAELVEGKIVRYDMGRIVSLLVFIMKQGTIFDCRKLWLEQLVLMIIAAVSGLLMYLAFTYHIQKDDRDPEETLDLANRKLYEFATSIMGLVTFVLGLFVSLVVERWWRLYKEGLDKLQRGVTFLVSTLTTFYGDQYDRTAEKIIHRIYRYGRLSLALIYASQLSTAKEQREFVNMLFLRGLATDEEAGVLLSMRRTREEIPWVWIHRILHRLYLDGVIPSDHMYTLMTQRASIAQDGAAFILGQLGTQLPMTYVHMVSLLVKVNNIVVAVAIGPLIFISFVQHPDGTGGDSTQLVPLTVYLLTILIIPVLFNGLLIVCQQIDNPFANSTLDYPGWHIDQAMRQDAVNIIRGSHHYDPCQATPLANTPTYRQHQDAAKTTTDSDNNHRVDSSRPQQQQQQGAAAGGGGGEGTVSVQDLQSKYSELLQYNKAVEKEKAQLEKQVKALKEQQGAGRKGCPTYVVVLVIAVSLAIAKLVAWF
mmetsp:Transcript_6216/g.17875  ORF Transcript_6216/g.17875 Transcript_6216/m.17875 type:complete len:530 (+) Transcript_6216:60-1649(+)